MLHKNKPLESLNAIKNFTTPHLYEGVDSYVAFYAFDPATGKMKRKKIRLNRISNVAERRKYAAGLCKRLEVKLLDGWNPWVELDSPLSLQSINDVADLYRRYIVRMQNDDAIRPHTAYDYQSKLNVMLEYNDTRRIPITYIYQLDTPFVNSFLDYIYIKKENSIRTRNNYLVWLNVFIAWLQQRSFLTDNPAEKIQVIKQRGHKKNRDLLDKEDLNRLSEFLERTNPHFKLACMILNYMFIRPKEMARIRLNDFNVQGQTLVITDDISKNRKTQVVTVPRHIIEYMMDLDIFNNSGKCYLFSEGFRPGMRFKSEKAFSDYWMKRVRPAMGWNNRIKFYSLKDTGITNMLRTCDAQTVRDQARHSSIQITDIYTPHDIKKANPLLKNYKSEL